ncbi:MAG: DUF2845 domain-containing protein [Desulfobacterales bacterium]
MKYALSLVTVVLLLLVGIASVHALRCGTELVTEGSSKFEVLEACGQPIKKFGDGILIDEDDPNYIVRSYLNEKWIYDLGGGVYHMVHFTGDRVTKIEIERK